MIHFLGMIFIGIVAGWLSGQIMKGRGFGLLGNLVVGIVGAVIAWRRWGSSTRSGLLPTWGSRRQWISPATIRRSRR